MRHHRKNDLLTLVLTLMLWNSSLAFAKGETQQKLEPISTSPVLKKNSAETLPTAFEDSMSLTGTPPPPEGIGPSPLIATRRLTKESTNFSSGFWMGPLMRFAENENLFYISISKSRYLESQIAREWSFELTSNGMFGGSYGYKWLQSLNSYNEPYLKISLGALFTTNENFGTLIQWKRYQIRGALGLDDLFSLGRQFRCEAAMVYSGLGMSLAISGTYAF